MVYTYFPIMTRGLSPVFALLLFGGQHGELHADRALADLDGKIIGHGFGRGRLVRTVLVATRQHQGDGGPKRCAACQPRNQVCVFHVSCG